MDGTGRLAIATHLALGMITWRKSSIFCSKHLTQYVAGRSLIHPPVRPDTTNIIPLLLPPPPLGPLGMIKDRLTSSTRTG